MKGPNRSESGLGGGMRVAVRRGEIPLQQLTDQDEAVALRAGAYRRITDVSAGSADTVIRIDAHAFGAGRPHHDLLLGPGAAVRVTDPAGASALVPARRLVNGATVTELPGTGHELWDIHLGLADATAAPDLVLVQGLAVGSAGLVAHAQAGHPVTEARRALLAQAAILGWQRSSEADFHVVSDGRRLPVAVRKGSTLAYDLVESSGPVALRSIAATPAEIEADSQDGRLLGVAISRLALDGEEIDLGDPRLVRGFYQVESAGGEEGAPFRWRWTDGDAQLLPERAGRLEVTIHLTMKAWTKQEVGAERTLFEPTAETERLDHAG